MYRKKYDYETPLIFLLLLLCFFLICYSEHTVILKYQLKEKTGILRISGVSVTPLCHSRCLFLERWGEWRSPTTKDWETGGEGQPWLFTAICKLNMTPHTLKEQLPGWWLQTGCRAKSWRNQKREAAPAPCRLQRDGGGSLPWGCGIRGSPWKPHTHAHALYEQGKGRQRSVYAPNCRGRRTFH